MDLAAAEYLVSAAATRLLADSLPDDPLARVGELRSRGASPQEARWLAALAEARRRAAGKLPDPPAWVLDAAGLEQATPAAITVLHAHWMGDAQHVLDGTAGLGVDAAALGGWAPATLEDTRETFLPARRVTAIERDPARHTLLRANLAAHLPAERFATRCADVREVLAAGQASPEWDAVFLDPARRAADHRAKDGFESRVVGLAETSPPLPALLPVLGDLPVLVKAAPGLYRREIPEGWQVRFVSFGGELKEAALSRGLTAGMPDASLAAVAVRLDPATGRYTVTTRAGNGESPPPPSIEADTQLEGSIVLLPDPAARRARAWPWEWEPQALDAHGTVCLAGSDASETNDPLWRAMRVVATTPLRERNLERAVRALPYVVPDTPVVRRIGPGIPASAMPMLEALAPGGWWTVATRVRGSPRVLLGRPLGEEAEEGASDAFSA